MACDQFHSMLQIPTGFAQLRCATPEVSLLSLQARYMLSIDMWDWRGNYFHAEADSVRVDSVKRLFRLHLPRDYFSYTGRGADGLRVHAGTFSTYDRNNLYGSDNCAVR